MDDEKVYFGDSSYEQYHDKIGYYKDKDHHDEHRRHYFNKRFAKQSKKKYSPAWWSKFILW